MAFTFSGVFAIRNYDGVNIPDDLSEPTTLRVNFNAASLVGSTGTITAIDEDGDSYLEPGETFNYKRDTLLIGPGNKTGMKVLGIGIQNGALRNYLVVVAEDSDGNQYFFYPNGTPDVFTNIGGAFSTTITFYPDSRYDGEEYIPCFARGTLIDTGLGRRPVESLSVGDLIKTKNSGLQAIRWIGSRFIDTQLLLNFPNLTPIRIRSGSLGDFVPEFDLLVSPQHRILCNSDIVKRIFDTEEVLVAAKHLCGLQGVEVADDIKEVDYFHILLDHHEVIYSNGAETESLYLGDQALASLSHEAISEISTIFPDIFAGGDKMKQYCVFSSGRKGKEIAFRHVKNTHHSIQAGPAFS